MEALPDGFRLTFTEPVDPATAGDLAELPSEGMDLYLPVEVWQPDGR
jgi:hypothetical protein